MINGQDLAQAAFKLVSSAYEVLGDEGLFKSSAVQALVSYCQEDDHLTITQQGRFSVSRYTSLEANSLNSSWGCMNREGSATLDLG